MNNLKKWNPYKDDNWIVYSNEAKPGTVHTINGEEYYVAYPDLKWDIKTENKFFKDKSWKVDFDWPHIITSHITDMSFMFGWAKKTGQIIWGWDLDNITEMEVIFTRSIFNQNISNWDTSNVTNMDYMFRYLTSFTQDLSNWDTSSVVSKAYFDQGTKNWDDENKPKFK